MNKSVITVISGLVVVSVSVLAYVSFSERSADTEETASVVLKSKGTEVLPSAEIAIGPILSKPKDVGILPLPKKHLSVSLKKEERSLLEQMPITQEDMLRVIESFGKPTKEALRWITKDQRHKEFESSLEKLFGDTLPKEAREAVMESARLAWFRQDMLTAKYESGGVDMDRYLMGLEEVIRADTETLARTLTDEQYMTLMGESKGERFPERGRDPIVPTEGYTEMLSLFPALRDGERAEVSSSQDVYKVVSKEAIDEVARLSRERLRVQRELQHAFLAGDIQEEALKLGLDRARQTASDKIDAVLSPEQELFLYGHSDRWDAMMPEKRKGGKDES